MFGRLSTLCHDTGTRLSLALCLCNSTHPSSLSLSLSHTQAWFCTQHLCRGCGYLFTAECALMTLYKNPSRFTITRALHHNNCRRVTSWRRTQRHPHPRVMAGRCLRLPRPLRSQQWTRM